ncbi:MAG: hypothetical protein TUN42_03565 [Dehalogenimonas sp.]
MNLLALTSLPDPNIKHIMGRSPIISQSYVREKDPLNPKHDRAIVDAEVKKEPLSKKGDARFLGISLRLSSG